MLDVACGPGIVTAALAPMAREVVAFDLTPEMLIKARERCTKAGRTNVLFQEGSATALPFADASFDVAVTRLSLHHFEEPQKVLAEMLRDPSHVRMLPASELTALMTGRGLSLERREIWDKPRELEEWIGIVANPARVAPLRTVVHALAKAGLDAGMGLAMRESAVHFFHRWQLVTARKI